MLILDISYYQRPENIDYDKLVVPVDGVIIRAAYGIWKDSALETHYKELKRRGVPLGVYQFLIENEPVSAQIATLKDATAGKSFEMGLWADVELEAGADMLTKQTVHEYIQGASTLGDLGIYTSAYQWATIMGGVYYTDRKLWVANYTTASAPLMPVGWTKWWLWQYTSTGTVDGYNSSLDCNRFWGNEIDFAYWVGSEPQTSEPLEHLYYPLDKAYPVTQYFGVNPAYYPTSQGHNGIDYGCNTGTPVYAAWDGVVEVAREDTGGYGRHIRIRHSHGVTIYGHLSRMDVVNGQSVDGMQQIGLSGGNIDDPYCGYSTGPHLHFEYRWDIPVFPLVPGSYVYNAVDPLPLLIPWDDTPVDEDAVYNRALDDAVMKIGELKL